MAKSGMKSETPEEARERLKALSEAERSGAEAANEGQIQPAFIDYNPDVEGTDGEEETLLRRQEEAPIIRATSDAVAPSVRSGGTTRRARATTTADNKALTSDATTTTRYRTK